ncbi:MAG: hypothetical protein RMK51_03135 [Meiothermus sp.]|uniref:hypothetical protein n=1 Tax=Meiothermus sp. TaxID=1955249 RepID=UPI0025F2745C|nr:hypothetical protein [Meiothermus sp.]MCS7068715.1 hypothetical protein [Meiothermus sp.]MDW8424903.1 hypothetical protein [Meiothermus sp.]
MRKPRALNRANLDILLFQLSNFLFSPLLYFLLGKGHLEKGVELVQKIYLIEVYLAVPVVIFYFNQQRIAEAVEVFGRALYDGIGVAKLVFSFFMALIVVYLLKATEPSMFFILLICFFGNAITPHWMLSMHSYTVFTAFALLLRLIVLLTVLFGLQDYVLMSYAASLLLPGLFTFFYYRQCFPKKEGFDFARQIAQLLSIGLLSLVRNFSTSSLLMVLLSSVPASALPAYAASERFIRSGFSFLVPYILRLNLSKGLRVGEYLVPMLLASIGAAFIYYHSPNEWLLWLLAASLVLAADLLAFLQSEQKGSEVANMGLYLLPFILLAVGIAGIAQFYTLLLVLLFIPLILKRS